MSERSKGDTSSSVSPSLPTSARIVKNPLLSASVTGLTFDDFQNKPLLLPAAPPIIHPSPVPCSRESTPLVTVGKSSDIDSEDLSEINLNDTSGTSATNNTGKSDENLNPLIEPSNQSDNSILSQAASSFSQLPSVASSVFSTFSKKFNSASSRDDINSNPVPQLDIQPFATEFPSQPQSSLPPPPTDFGNQQQGRSDSYTETSAQSPQPPPTFYSPSEVPAVPSASTVAPPGASGQNTYRISAKKKIYAPIPGLSSNHADQNLAPTGSTPTFLPPIGFETSSVPIYGDQPAGSKPEERKGGLFSLSSYVPAVPNVLQNLSGLVQSATGSLAPKTQEQNQPSSQQKPIDSFVPFEVGTQAQGASLFYSTSNPTSFIDINQPVQQDSVNQPLPPVNFFAPESQKATSDQLAHQESAKLKQELPAANLFPPLPPKSEGVTPIFPPFAVNPQPSAPPLPLSDVYPQTKTPESNPVQFAAGAALARPPSTAPSSTSFRLQKGTRLYKSPFAPAPSAQEQHHTGYGYPPAPPNIIPLNQEQTEIFSPFNLQQEQTLTTAAVIPPAGIGKPATTPILEPTCVPNLIPGNLCKEIPSVPSLLTASNPIQTPTQEEIISSTLQPTLSTSAAVISDTSLKPPSPQPEIKRENTEIKEAPVIESLNVADTNANKEQVLKISQFEPQASSLLQNQSNVLPPPPVSASGSEPQSKETANFPPPPPQHSLQSKANSNPYRRGLQAHQTVLPAPTSFSSFFSPSNQDLGLFKPITPDNDQRQPSSVTNFFTNQTPSVVFKNQPEVNQKPSPIIEPSPPEPTPKQVLSEQHTTNKHQSLAADSTDTLQTHIPPSAVALADPLLIADNDKSSPPLSKTIPDTKDTTSLIETASSEQPDKGAPRTSLTISSIFGSTSEVEINPNLFENKAPAQHPPPSTNLLNFFQTAAQPSKVLAVENTPATEQLQPPQAPVPLLPTSANITSPLNPPENSHPQQSVPNLISTFFEAESSTTPSTQQQSLPDPTSFFDTFSPVPTVGVDPAPPEDPNSLRIQNFFNNPPPKDLDPVGDLNYDLVGSGLSVKNLQTRSLTPASNLAEPPSSSCSEFSELNSSLSAANRQPRLPAEDSAKVSPEEESIFETDNQEIPEEILNEIKMANSASGAAFQANATYKPATKHWFYKRKEVSKFVWTPFSHYDSALLEDAFLRKNEGGPNLVAVEGGRYDVNIVERVKAPIYWEGDPIEVKRCSWFYKASDSKYVPYEEEIADLLEEEYRKASETAEWHKKIPISATDTVVFHGPTVIVQFQQQQQVDSWGGSTQTTSRPRVVKRDLEDFTIEEGESHKVDHLLFMVHGIGSACDLKMRPLEEVVDEFRGIALQLVQSHYKNSVENGFVGRVEVLPVSWHGELHSDELGIDEKLKSITLESIPKLRNFTNDTLLDILFYTSPMFCQRIMNTITASMNNIYVKYRQRNPDFHGGVSLAGHSLGSLILFDLLCHQRPLKDCEDQNMENPDGFTPGFPVDSNLLNEDADKHISYQMGPAGTGQPFISYPQLIFQPKKFFALGSPIGMFVTIRGIDKLGLDFRLPTCSGFYNIFHPYDPVAYRLEALVNPDMTGIPPVLIPHHKGRKRMHLEFKETMSRVGADLKQRFFDTFKTTFDTVSFLAPKSKNEAKEMEKEVDKVLKLQEQQADQSPTTSRPRTYSNSTNQSDNEIIEVDFPLGKLNDSKRIDYVLQEAPLEFFNEYLFALSSHVCYWESEDTILFVMKEIYQGIGYSPDSQVPQQTMTIERPSSSAGLNQT